MPYQPPGWRDYTAIGEQVPGTRFIPFKTPLKDQWNVPDIAKDRRLYPRLLIQLEPEIGLVIDLTKTRYYPNTQLTKHGIEYKRIKLPTEAVAEYSSYKRFRDTVNRYLQRNNGKLIGVHSKHGVNRAGYMICRYMIEELGVRPSQAIQDFRAARGAGIERQEFIDALMSYQPRISDQYQHI